MLMTLMTTIRVMKTAGRIMTLIKVLMREMRTVTVMMATPMFFL